MDSTQAALALKSEATILDLNDDCLLHVFHYMVQDELAAVADVCDRFRQNARLHFARSKYKNSYKIEFLRNTSLLEASKVMRNFGAYFKMIWLEGDGDLMTPRNYCEKSLQLVNQYCRPIEMMVRYYDITENIDRLMRPLLARLQKLEMQFCSMTDVFLNALPELTPELQEWGLYFSYRYTSKFGLIRFVVAQPKFHKLQKIIYTAVAVDNNSFEEFLKFNPQLAHIGMHRCPNINDNLFEAIVKHVPHIESICFGTCERGDSFEPIKTKNIKYFGQLMNLKSLELCVAKGESSSMFAVAVVKEIVRAKIPLEHLHLDGIDSGDESDRFADYMAKLENLKTLSLRSVENLSTRQVLDCCKQLSELSEFRLLENETHSKFSADSLLELTRNSSKLRIVRCGIFHCVEKKIVIGLDTYMKMVDAVSNRCENKPLLVCLNKSGYSANIPDELVRAHTDSVILSFAYTVVPFTCPCHGGKLNRPS